MDFTDIFVHLYTCCYQHHMTLRKQWLKYKSDQSTCTFFITWRIFFLQKYFFKMVLLQNICIHIILIQIQMWIIKYTNDINFSIKCKPVFMKHYKDKRAHHITHFSLTLMYLKKLQRNPFGNNYEVIHFIDLLYNRIILKAVCDIIFYIFKINKEKYMLLLRHCYSFNMWVLFPF